MSGCSGESERLVVVLGNAIEESYETTGNTSDWSTETVIDPHLQSPHIEVVEIGVQRSISLPLTLNQISIYILLHQMSILRLFESLSKEVSDMSKDNEDKI